MTSPSFFARTGEILITARFSVTSIGSSLPSRSRRRPISESMGPRIFSTASLSVMPSTGSPSMCVMKSPDLMPAVNAGVSSMGDTTLTRPFSIVTSMPRPPNSPRVWTCMSL
ncbi:MAG: hypothetical protein U1E45_09305 [Geminicoccaceae bacterium]